MQFTIAISWVINMPITMVFINCKLGLGYDVEYPKFKYTIRRSNYSAYKMSHFLSLIGYADNFKWPGDPNKEDTDC